MIRKNWNLQITRGSALFRTKSRCERCDRSGQRLSWLLRYDLRLVTNDFSWKVLKTWGLKVGETMECLFKLLWHVIGAGGWGKTVYTVYFDKYGAWAYFTQLQSQSRTNYGCFLKWFCWHVSHCWDGQRKDNHWTLSLLGTKGPLFFLSENMLKHLCLSKIAELDQTMTGLAEDDGIRLRGYWTLGVLRFSEGAFEKASMIWCPNIQWNTPPKVDSGPPKKRVRVYQPLHMFFVNAIHFGRFSLKKYWRENLQDPTFPPKKKKT